MMRKYLLVLLTASFLISCDDGDLIVTNFDFESNTFQSCTGPQNRQVFFKLNNDLSNEAIALAFNLEPASEDFLIAEVGTLTIPLNTRNQVIYRTFNSEVESDYFCNEIPPISPRVVEEYRSTSGGEIVITSTLRNDKDLDQDGVLNTVENAVESENTVNGFPDTDNDGIPNFLDTDDDNDNIPTSTETGEENTSSGYPDSDGDGVADYLDPDDDNDGVLTRYEDWNEDRNPTNDTNDEGIPHYLNPEIADAFEVSSTPVSNISIGFSYEVYIRNLTLVRQGGDGEQIRIDNYGFGFLNSAQTNIDPKEFLEDEGERNNGE